MAMTGSRKPTKLFFITGFLGAGKTTFLNNLLSQLQDKRIGLIINDFGQVNIDSALINAEQALRIKGLNNGQIFCSCLSGSFVQSIVDYQDHQLDYLLVESSGLARPANIGDILFQVRELTGELFEFGGMFCLVDALNFIPLVGVVRAVHEQIVYSDCVIINKKDLVDRLTIQRIKKVIKKSNPQAEILTVINGQLSVRILDKNYYFPERVITEFNGCENKSPVVYWLKASGKLSRDGFEGFIRAIAPYTYRIKGFIMFEGQLALVDAVNTNYQISNRLTTEQKSATGIVLFSRIGKALPDKIDKLWKKFVNTAYSIS